MTPRPHNTHNYGLTHPYRTLITLFLPYRPNRCQIWQGPANPKVRIRSRSGEICAGRTLSAQKPPHEPDMRDLKRRRTGQVTDKRLFRRNRPRRAAAIVSGQGAFPGSRRGRRGAVSQLWAGIPGEISSAIRRSLSGARGAVSGVQIMRLPAILSWGQVTRELCPVIVGMTH